MSNCHIRTASDGTRVRVNGGDIDQQTLDDLTEKVKAYIASRCKHASPYPMPEIAQRIHGRETYTCGREDGHTGGHRWPDKPDSRWKWDE